VAGGKIRGITVEIGGDTTKLGNALKSSEMSTKSLQSELRQVDKLLQFDPSNTDLLAQRQRILSQAVEETSEKLRVLEQAEKQVVEQFERGDIGEDQLRAFQREIIETQNKLSKFEDDLGGTTDGLKKVGDSAEDSGDGFTIMKGAIADLVSNAISGAISSIGNLIGSLLELSEATEEYRTMQAKLSGSAETFGYSVEFANEKYEEFYKYLGDDQMATNAITNLMGLGTSTESVTALAEGATAVWSAYGDSIPIEGLTEALNETAQVGKVTGSLADALNWAGISEDDFNAKLEKCTSTQERADLIAKTLNDRYGESKTRYDELNKSVLDTNNAELKLKDTQALLGEAVTPVNNALTNMKNQALQAILPLVESLANAFMNLYNWLQQNPTAMSVLTAVVVALTTAFTVLAGALAIQGLINGVTKAFALLNTTMLANPIVLIVALIAGLVTAFVLLWNKCEGFRNFWKNLWNNLKSVAKTMIDAVVGFFTELPGKIRASIANAITFVKDWGNQIKNTATNAISSTVSSVVNWASQIPGKIWSAIIGAVGKLVEWGGQMASTAKTEIGKVASSITNGLKKVPGEMLKVGKDIVKGLWKGISGMTSWIKNNIVDFATGLIEKAQDALDINSPSKKFENLVGKNIVRGVGVGITNNEDIALDAIDKMSNDMLNGATLNRKLNATFTPTIDGAGESGGLLGKLDAIYERLDRLQIVLDTGVLVGETIDKIDRSLADKRILSARGV